jgi:uncharacterized protein (DUF1810 family)
MPSVNGKRFAYTAKGVAAAKAEAKRTGKKMSGTMEPLFPAVKKKPTILTPKRRKKPKIGNL